MSMTRRQAPRSRPRRAAIAGVVANPGDRGESPIPVGYLPALTGSLIVPPVIGINRESN